ncbi:DUF5134 domain-containing protein [Streptomyces sp. AK02-01A]|uniref:DUF5134 domain-containing protein n=1 Tax=Streptomyces sp. AK02-01A TaxID=3028648 RepID=UPI0029B5857C|nr:DUF5134 domain-containing protein [Streptomyces sp. AK02-01A]MDX3854726.1 DUF5134 domain-containing protein [Streptomyces sp. AK02-01A]
MHGPATAGWLLVALCAAAGGYCLLRLRSSVDEQRSSAGGEALMAFGMAVMAVPTAVVTPPRWVWPVYVVVFGGAALYAMASARGAPHHLHHLLGTLAMVYMAWAMAQAPAGAHGAHLAGGTPLITGLLLIYYAGYVLWTGGRLLPLPSAAEGGVSAGAGIGFPAGSGAGVGVAAGAGWGDRPELALVCRLSMGLAMLAMLLTL